MFATDFHKLLFFIALSILILPQGVLAQRCPLCNSTTFDGRYCYEKSECRNYRKRVNTPPGENSEDKQECWSSDSESSLKIVFNPSVTLDTPGGLIVTTSSTPVEMHSQFRFVQNMMQMLSPDGIHSDPDQCANQISQEHKPVGTDDINNQAPPPYLASEALPDGTHDWLTNLFDWSQQQYRSRVRRGCLVRPTDLSTARRWLCSQGYQAEQIELDPVNEDLLSMIIPHLTTPNSLLHFVIYRTIRQKEIEENFFAQVDENGSLFVYSDVTLMYPRPAREKARRFAQMIRTRMTPKDVLFLLSYKKQPDNDEQ